ncbi:MAG: hypothetical protein IT547_07130 [Hyphomonadaceae bacterium]|nr:hypothetical protein [Hyphomonadaceae bacterium]
MTAIAAIASLDGAAAQRACALLAPTEHERARLLCFQDHALHDWRAPSADALAAQLDQTPIRACAALVSSLPAAHNFGVPRNASPPRHAAAAACGAIANLRPLRKHMIASGWLDHDVDESAVVAALVDFYLRKAKQPLDAVRAALRKLQGAFTIAVIVPESPVSLFIASKHPGVAVGFVDGAACALSDARLRPHGAELTPLQADDVAILTPRQIVLTDLDGMQIVKHPRSAPLLELSHSAGHANADARA